MNTVMASIIIPVYNRHGELQRLLHQLSGQTNTAFEVVLVDDGSDPPINLRETETPLPFPVVLKRHTMRSGIGKARNTGVQAAGAPLLLFLDSDGDLLDHAWFEKHLRLHRRAKELAAAAGKDLCVVHSEVLGTAPGWWGKVDGYSNWYGSTGRKEKAIRDRHVPTHNTSVEKAIFERTGLFDETLEVLEDVEWGLRCLSSGIALYYLPGAPVRHLDRSTFRSVWRHYETFGYFAPLVRKKAADATYSFLFPRGMLSALLLFLPVTGLMTLYILFRWIGHRPQVLWYLPGLYIANVAYYAGICRRLREG
ncbi:MAG TPA: glycosyltransferase family 2 protein [Candidatus Hydrogenedentes bacterium]|nr:MAG: putative glycosyltransferase EpsH [Candidatus Hydrogenedentes bacterium ADurb.Bin170]HPX87070.1 glycosyltransferase family 2 protein [Candidatus Hydrogenedentota bacterium]